MLSACHTYFYVERRLYLNKGHYKYKGNRTEMDGILVLGDGGVILEDERFNVNSFMQSRVERDNVTTGLIFVAHTYYHCIVTVDRSTLEMTFLGKPCSLTKGSVGYELDQYQFTHPRGKHVGRVSLALLLIHIKMID